MLRKSMHYKKFMHNLTTWVHTEINLYTNGLTCLW